MLYSILIVMIKSMFQLQYSHYKCCASEQLMNDTPETNKG